MHKPVTGDDLLLASVRQASLGEYEILTELGRGGMACVYLGHDIALGRRVAIKVMLPEVLRHEGMIERFKLEARTAANLEHPHIIPIYAVRETADTLFFVMKFVEGRPLDSVIKELGKLPLDMARTLMAQVGGALDYAHRKGVIHRDIKPANIIVDTEGFAVVTDFGIARPQDAPSLTVTGSVVGTPHYMSPEQAMGSKLTGAADQYSLGILAYEMLTGHVPFDSPTLMGVLLAHRDSDPMPIDVHRADAPPGMMAAVARMLAKTPEERFPTVKDAAVAFAAQARDDATAVRTALSTLAKAAVPATPRYSTPRSAPMQAPPAPAQPVSPPTLKLSSRSGPSGTRPAPKKSRLVPLLTVLLLAAVGTIGWLVMGPRLTGGGAATDSSGAQTAALGLPVVPAPVDSAARSVADSSGPADSAVAPADSAPLAAAPAPDTSKAVAPVDSNGYIRIIGDLPEDAIIWLNERRIRSRAFAVPPGRHAVEVETEEFEPWERRFMVRARDTIRLRVELELKADSL